MKKHQIVAVVGTLALAVNLLVPGLALGQNNQYLNAQVNCNAGSPATTFGDVPGDVTFRNPGPGNQSYAIVAGQNTDAIDTNVTSTAGDIPNKNILEVIMGNSGGANGCPLTNAGFVVTAASTDLSSGANSIPAGNIKMVTTSTITGNSGGVVPQFATVRTGYQSPALTADNTSVPNNDVLYSDTQQLGNAHDVTAPLTVSASADLSGSTVAGSNGSIATNYNNGALLNAGTDNNYNSFLSGQQLTVLGSCTGHGVSAATARTGTHGTPDPTTGELQQYQTAIAVGAAVTVHVPDSQPTGNYTGTVTYTENSQNCPSQLTTLSSGVAYSDTNFSTATMANPPAAGTMVYVGGELAKVTASTATSLTVVRGQYGTASAAHATNTAIYIAGVSFADPITAGISIGNSMFTTGTSFSSGDHYAAGDIIIMSDGARYTVASADYSGPNVIHIIGTFAKAYGIASGVMDTTINQHVS